LVSVRAGGGPAVRRRSRSRHRTHLASYPNHLTLHSTKAATASAPRTRPRRPRKACS